jgi:hypothetical protein
MITDEQVDAVMIAALPEKIQWLFKEAHGYADNYLKAHGLSWKSAYETSYTVFMRKEEEVAVSDTTNNVPFEQFALARMFGGDEDMATAMYWLTVFHARARVILDSLRKQQTAHLGEPGEAPPPRDGEARKMVHENVFAHRRALQGYATLLEAMHIQKNEANQCARQLEAALSKEFVYRSPPR